MKTWNLSARALGVVGASIAAVLLSPMMMNQRASAFGGLWSSQASPVKQVGQRVIFVDNPDATITAVVQLHYEGAAQKFAWLIPVPGRPTVGVSSSVVFERLEAATAPQYWVEVAVSGVALGGMCMQQAYPQTAPAEDAGVDAAASSADGGTAAVAVVDRGTVGPYDYVTIAPDKSLAEPAKVATDWLTANGYDLTALDSKVLGPYLDQGLNLLAFKLTKGTDRGSVRPVTLTYESALPRIPLVLTAVATQPDLGVQVWVIGPSQAVPSNYKSLVLNDAVIDWQGGQKYVAGTPPAGGGGPSVPFYGRPENYDLVVSAAANEAGGQGFVTELAEPASQFRDAVWSAVDSGDFESLSSEEYADGIDAVLAASSHYARWDGFTEALQGATTLPEGITIDAFGENPEQYRGVVQVDASKLFELLRKNVIAPVSDTALLFFKGPYLTRLYTTMSADEMTVDPVFDYNFDLTQVSNVHVARQLVQCAPMLSEANAPWRLDLPQGGVVTGAGASAWPVALGSMPSNLKVVQLSASGPGTVIVDNSAQIASALFGAATLLDTVTPRPPQTGSSIGGAQRVTPPAPLASTHTGDMQPSADGCQVSHVGTGSRSMLILWLAFVAALLARRRRRAPWLGLCACLLLVACSKEASVQGLPDSGVASASNDAATSVDPVEDAGQSVSSHTLTVEQLRDPETCKGCHPVHYREWSGSMHAYAAQDPVFLAMNKRGQRETQGALGNFCVRCHAPMAAFDGLTKDGLNLPELADSKRGVSCYFCHNVTGVTGDHNGLLRIANDTIMRGPITDPLAPPVHGAAQSDFLEESSPKSSAMCGACHDVVMPNGIRLERTYQEYLTGIFSKSATGEPPSFDSCVGCHMPPREGLAAVQPSGLPTRAVHEHLWPAVDLPLTAFPFQDAMRSAVEACALQKSIGFFTLEVTPPDLFTFQMEAGAGHNQPSGAAQDRRMWLEFLAYDKDGKLLDTVSSGNIADGEIEDKPADDPKHDPRLLMFRDRIYGADGAPVHMFWEAEKSAAHPDGHEASMLPPATTTYVEGKHAVVKQYRARGPDGQLPARVTARLRIRPVGLDVLQDLVDSGDLDPAIMAKMQTLDFGPGIEWTPADGLMKPIAAKTRADCSTYRCLLDPSLPNCH